jgi:hypothetical protein
MSNSSLELKHGTEPGCIAEKKLDGRGEPCSANSHPELFLPRQSNCWLCPHLLELTQSLKHKADVTIVLVWKMRQSQISQGYQLGMGELRLQPSFCGSRALALISLLDNLA